MKKNVRKTIEALKKNRFEVEYFKAGAEARDSALKMIPSGATVSFGGSATVKDCGLLDAIIGGPYKVINPYETNIAREESIERRRQGLMADFYVTGANAITLNGELVNIDGFGNRVAAQIFGPKKVLIIASIKKIVKDIKAGIKRIKEVAAPLNVKRLNRNTPCAVGRPCEECPPESSICNITTVIHRISLPGRVKIFLIEEDLGF